MAISKETSSTPKGSSFLLFIGPDEKLICEAAGVLDDRLSGQLVLTDKKLFFFFVSNISRDKTFIATYPYIVSAELKEGLLSSSLIIKNKKETFDIKRINKNSAKEFYKILTSIIGQNKTI
ncbi:MAG: PH domain-containing protein [Actinobacteria bacterium]|nr:PH domain-containing protein [Actinomycetota bacterium]